LINAHEFGGGGEKWKGKGKLKGYEIGGRRRERSKVEGRATCRKKWMAKKKYQITGNIKRRRGRLGLLKKNAGANSGL